MKYEDLLKLKSVNGLVLSFGSVLKFKVDIVPTTKEVGDNWVDGEGIELTGKWNGNVVKTDLIHDQKSLDEIEETITLLP